MKKQKTLLVVVLIVAILMVALYLAMGIMSGKEEKTADEVNKVPMLTEMEDITYVQYTNVDGAVTLVKTDGAWKSEDQPELAMVDGYVDERVAVLGQIEGTLVDDVTKAECGLETAIYKLTVKNADETVKLTIGVSDDGNYYAMLDGEEDIYEIDEKVINVLNMSASDFAEPTDDMSMYYINSEEIGAEEEMIDEAEGEVVDEPIQDTTTEVIDDTTSDVAEETPAEDTTTEELIEE